MEEMKRSELKQINRNRKVKKISLIVLVSLGLIALLSLLFLYLNAKDEARSRFFRAYPVRGISLDQSADYLDFNNFKQRGGKFVYLRCSQGADYLDDDFNDNYARSIGSGLKIGVYHQYGFATSIKAQAKNFSRGANGQIGQLPIRLDIDYYGEYTEKTVDRKRLNRRVSQLVDYLYHRYERPVLIKTNLKNYQALKHIPHTEFMLPKGHDGKNITFNKLKPRSPFYQDGKSSNYDMAAYLGNKVQWKAYLQRME